MERLLGDILETRKISEFAASTPHHRTNVTLAVKRIEMSFRTFQHNSSMAPKQQQAEFSGAGKENRIQYSDSSVSIAKQIKMRYEELANTRKSAETVRAAQNVTSTGAIKKTVVADKKIGNQEEINVSSRKRVKVYEDDDFVKSRFKIYADKKLKSIKETVGNKIETTSENGATKETIKRGDRCLQNINLPNLRLLGESSVGTTQIRSTPVDVPVVPLLPKKVKIEHRRNSMKLAEKPNAGTVTISHGLPYRVPYDDDFIMFEMERDFNSVSRHSRGFRQGNITIKQRNVIIKFLTRLNAHSFHPSFFLYQTVKIFDAALDAKPIEVEELQLTALTSMWIAVKKDHTVYGVPSAEKMISFASGLYAGRKDLLLKCERDILQSLNFDIGFPDPFSFLSYNITTSDCCCCMNDHQIDMAYYCGGYMIDLSLFDEELSNTSAALIAAAVAETALYFVLEDVERGTEPMWNKWRAPYAAKRFAESEINSVRSKLIEKINESTRRHSDVDIVFKKYSRSRYGKVAHILGHKVRMFLETECTIDLRE